MDNHLEIRLVDNGFILHDVPNSHAYASKYKTKIFYTKEELCDYLLIRLNEKVT